MDLDVVNMFVIAGGTLAIPILAFLASFLLWPAALIKIYYWYWRRRLGLQVDYAKHDGYRFCYTHRGKPGIRPSILMLHGFSAHKDMWLGVVKFFPTNVHLVCVDMPGHEGTTRTSAVDYSIEGQVKRIHQWIMGALGMGQAFISPSQDTLSYTAVLNLTRYFVESIQLNKKPFHLVGTSMGGCVAGVYAARYPSDLSSLTLICPAGLKFPKESEFMRRLRDLENSKDVQRIPLIPSTPEEMEDMLKLCSFVRFKIPHQILQGLVKVRIPHNNFYREVFMELVGEKSRHCLHENMHLISTPLQVIWGKQDQVLDVSGATLLADTLPGCQVELLDNCGHSVVMERPRKAAHLVMDFITRLQNSGSSSSKKLS